MLDKKIEQQSRPEAKRGQPDVGDVYDSLKLVRGNLSLVGEGNAIEAERKRGPIDRGLDVGTVYSYEIGDGLSFSLDVAPISFLRAYEKAGKLILKFNGFQKELAPNDIALVGSEVDFDQDVEINDISIAPRHFRIKYSGSGRLEVVNLDDRVEGAHGLRVLNVHSLDDLYNDSENNGKDINKSSSFFDKYRDLINGERLQPRVPYLIELPFSDSQYLSFADDNKILLNISYRDKKLYLQYKDKEFGPFSPDASRAITVGSSPSVDIRLPINGVSSEHIELKYVQDGYVSVAYIGNASKDKGLRFKKYLTGKPEYANAFGEASASSQSSTSLPVKKKTVQKEEVTRNLQANNSGKADNSDNGTNGEVTKVVRKAA